MAAMLVAAGMPMRWLGVAGGGGAMLVMLYAMTAPYRRDRLMTFLDPWAHAGDEGFQSVQGQIAIGSGGLFGRGLGESRAEESVSCPRPTPTSSWRSIGEELGVSGSAGCSFLYGLVAYAGLRIAKNARGTYAKLLAAGVTSPDPLPGDAQRLRRARPRAADRRAAAVHLLRVDEPHRVARRRWACC